MKDNACERAIKLLTKYEKLAEKMTSNISPDRLQELNRKRDAGTITIYDLPQRLRSVWPGEFDGMTLAEIREFCQNRKRR